MDQVFIMSSTICSSHIFDGVCVNRRLNTNKSVSLHWIALIWLVVVLPASRQQYAVHGLDELHIGGIFPIGGKGGWQGGNMAVSLVSFINSNAFDTQHSTAQHIRLDGKCV